MIARLPRAGSIRAGVFECAISWPGISAREIAEELGCAVQTAATALSRLRALRLVPRTPRGEAQRAGAWARLRAPSCPTCGAAPGARCSAPGGREYGDRVHAARRDP